MESDILDFSSQDREYFSATRKPKVVNLDKKTYVTFEGQGTPESVEYQAGIEVIYSAAFQLKFLQKGRGKNFRVSKLECLWWVDHGKSFEDTPMKDWRWKLLIRIPDYTTNADVENVAMKITEERGLRGASRLQIDSMKEGKCVQILHLGPYDKLGETYDKLLVYMKDSGLEHNGPYHEIYISDPNRTAPERLKTIVRQPVK